MAGFSQGFNSTFRSLDNAFQWRAQQDESARQYDETLSENKRQFNETAAQQNAVNQSLINLREIQGKELETLISQTQQEMKYAKQEQPVRMEGLRATNRLTDAQTNLTGQRARASELSNDYNTRTLDNRVAAGNAQYAEQEQTSRANIFSSQNDAKQNLYWATTDENGRQMTSEELVANPDKLAAFAGMFTQASDVMDAEFDIGEHDFASVKPVDAGDPSQGYYVLRSRAGKRGFEPIAGEDGQPVVIPAEEMVGYVDAARQEIDQGASLAGGGSARQEKVEAQAQDVADAQAGRAPAAPGIKPNTDPAQLEAQARALQAEREQIQRQLDEIPKPSRQRPNMSGVGWNPESQPQSEEYQALTEEKAALDRQLGDVLGNLNEHQIYETRVNQYDEYQRTLANLTERNTVRALRPEAMDRQVAGAEATTNRMNTGRADVSAEDLQAQRQELLTDMQDLIRSKLSFRRVMTDDGWDSQKDEAMGNRLANQLHSLVTGRDTGPVWKKALDSGMVPSIVQSAIDLSGNDPDRVSLQAGLTMQMENVATQDVGLVMDYVTPQVVGEGEDTMPPEQYKQLLERVTQVVSSRGSNDRVTPGEAKALAAQALNPQRTQRTLGD